MKRARVLLADDHRVVAEGLRGLLALHYDVVGIVSDGRELLAAAQQLDPDVVVLDISMPSLNGIEAARHLRGANSRAKVIFLTMHREVTYAARSLEAGASGFVLKHSAASELVTAIQEALKGGTYITPQIAGELVGALQRGAPAEVNALDELTPRQREVLQLVAEGHSNKQIAALLGISCRTAEFHKARLMEGLGLQTTAELVQCALRAGLIPPSERRCALRSARPVVLRVAFPPPARYNFTRPGTGPDKHGLPTVTIGSGQYEIHTVHEYVDLPEFANGCCLAVALATLEG